MQLATSMNIGKVMDEEAKRERFASWYITLPGIPEYEKEMIEKSLKYNVWKELITLFVIYMILSLTWFFGAGLYDPFQSITGYKLTGKKNVIAVVQEDGQSLRLNRWLADAYPPCPQRQLRDVWRCRPNLYYK